MRLFTIATDPGAVHSPYQDRLPQIKHVRALHVLTIGSLEDGVGFGLRRK